MSDALKSCPEGLDHAVIGSSMYPSLPTGLQGYCDCGWSGPVGYTEAEAITAWNHRAEPYQVNTELEPPDAE